MTAIPPPNANRPIIDGLGAMVQSFRRWANRVTRSVPIRGTGSPVGVVEGLEDQLYFDTTGGPGANMYIKKFDQVAGDKTQGWELI